MEKIIIVGSGPSGVHFALSVLRKGYPVVMLDVGHERPDMLLPEADFTELKSRLDDPVRYFLGEDYEAVIYPDAMSEFYGIPPSKNYVFTKPDGFGFQSKGFSPLFSFAQGGLAEVWTGSAYPFNDHELEDFPFNYRDIEPHYGEVARRIGITGVHDDLEAFIPFHGHIHEPVDLDEHSEVLLSAYEKHKGDLNHRLKCFFGRSRVATLGRDENGRKACNYCGRCLWGCPSGALYTPAITLEQCREYPNFQYLPGVYISHFRFDSRHRITHAVGETLGGDGAFEIALDKLVLAGGTLSSSRIFMESIFRNAGEVIKLTGLMDNRQILVPFVNLKMVGRAFDPKSYQYHQVALGIDGDKPQEYVHGLITTLKTAIIHPVIKNLPVDLKTAIFMFQGIRAGLGVVNINFCDRRREQNYLTLETAGRSARSNLVINYLPPDNEKKSIQGAIRKVRKALLKLGCFAPPPMTHVRPMGASAHYSGTLPMSAKKSEYTTSRDCRSHDFDNLYIVDGTTFPFLPAKNLTFSLMANAVRVAETAF